MDNGQPPNDSPHLPSAQQQHGSLADKLKSLLPKPTAAEIATLKAKARETNPYAEPTLISTESGLHVVVTVPVPKRAYQDFRRRMSTNVGRDQAIELLFRDVLLFPNPADVETALLLKPGLAETFGNEVAKLAGLEDHVEGKAL